jgi:gliding motility-associated-like protein
VDPNAPVTNFSYAPICQNNSAAIALTENGFTSGGIFYGSNLNVNTTTGLVNLTSATAGTYLVTYSIVANGCAANNTANLVILPVNPIALTPSISIAPGSSITLNASGATNYTWSPSINLSCTDCPDPIASPSQNIQYCVTSSLGSCISKACVDIVVSCEGATDFSTANAFTPNGDNNNDEFCLQGWNNCVKDFNVKIFDRWGEKVYESNSPDFCWDGIYKGQLLSNNVYVYLIKATKFDKSSITKKGNITLIR